MCGGLGLWVTMVALVSIGAPSAREIEGNSREYALLIQLIKSGQQPVDESVSSWSWLVLYW